MNNPIRILYIDDNPLDRELVRDALEKERGGFALTLAATRAEFESHLAAQDFDLVLSDFNILGFEGLQVIDAVRVKNPRVPVVIVTGTGSEEIGVAAMKHGAADYVIKTPQHMQRLPQTIHAALERTRARDERERAEEALRESEERYRRLTEQIPAIVYIEQIMGDSGRILYLSPQAKNLLGVSDEKIRQDGINIWASYMHPDDRPRVRAEYRRCFLAKEPFDCEYRMIASDGRLVWIQDQATTLTNNDDGSLLIQGVMYDITERKGAEEELRASEEKFRALYQTALDITATRPLNELLSVIVARACKLLDAPVGGMYLTEPEKKQARVVVSYNTPRDYTGNILKYGEGVGGRVAETGAPLLIDDYAKWEGKAAPYTDEPFHALMAIPIIWRNETIGVLQTITQDATRRFDQADINLITLFANQAAVAIQNARLLESEKAARAQAQILATANAALTQSLDLDVVLNTLAVRQREYSIARRRDGSKRARPTRL